MSMRIRYVNCYDSNRDIDFVSVFLGNPKRKVGEIVRRDGGWQYFPQGATKGGGVFPTLRQCMDSLEAA